MPNRLPPNKSPEDVLTIWRDWADDVHGKAIDGGHYLAEEAPDETYTELHTFFAL